VIVCSDLDYICPFSKDYRPLRLSDLAFHEDHRHGCPQDIMLYLQVTIFCLENSIHVRILQVQKLTKSKMVVITKNKDIVPIRQIFLDFTYYSFLFFLSIFRTFKCVIVCSDLDYICPFSKDYRPLRLSDLAFHEDHYSI
jgi:hypothetical protein